jgi:hypothetical protein
MRASPWFCILLVACAHRGAQPAAARPLDPLVIGTATRLDPVHTADGVVRVSFARDDVSVTVDGSPLAPAAGLTTWAAFTPAPGGALLMSDTVLFEDEVTAALDTALGAGLDVTALDSHFLHERPRVYFLHITARGNTAYLAGALRDVWDTIDSVRKVRPDPTGGSTAPQLRTGALDSGAIERIVGYRVASRDGVVRFAVPRAARVQGVRISGAMGLVTRASFSGSDAAAALSGEVLLTAPEMQRTLQSLRANGISVVGVHKHLVGETPSYYMVHFWGTGRARDLAVALRAALDAQAGG